MTGPRPVHYAIQRMRLTVISEVKMAYFMQRSRSLDDDHDQQTWMCRGRYTNLISARPPDGASSRTGCVHVLTHPNEPRCYTKDQVSLVPQSRQRINSEI